VGAGPDSRVLFTNSGAEANEAALKLSRRLRPGGGWVACEGAFHGRTMGALAVTGQPAKREPFAPLPGPVTFVPYGDGAALAAAVTSSTASVVLEPVMGEAGVVVPPAGFLEAARAACDAHGALLHLDEVQGGAGRVGAWLTSTVTAPGVVPDVVTLAKALGGGLPIGAVVANGRAATALAKGDHGTTFGGGPVVCAAALAVLRTVEQEGLLERATVLGAHLREGLLGLGHPLVREVRGLGLWLGIVLTEPVAAAVEAAARDAGFLVNAAAPDVLRLLRPSSSRPSSSTPSRPRSRACSTPCRCRRERRAGPRRGGRPERARADADAARGGGVRGRHRLRRPRRPRRGGRRPRRAGPARPRHARPRRRAVLERLREDPVLSQIPVIVVTGHEDALPDVRAQLGHDNVFLKPFAVAELLARVDAVTGGP
jgi:hypothetical protein